MPIPPYDSHRQAVSQTERWARASADDGDLEDAIAWLDTLESVDGHLDDRLVTLRAQWRRAMDRNGSSDPSRRP